MPTGYTAKLMEKGETFEEFVWTCARAFGALITMRDDPHDAPIPQKLEPSKYYLESLEKAKRDYAELINMNDSAKLGFGERKKAEDIAQSQDWTAKRTEENKRIEKMEALVKKWEPPSGDHVELKEFMLQQLDVSRHSLEYDYESIGKAKEKAPVDYYAEAVSRAERNIEYYTEEWEKEVERTNGRNRWLQQLRESLNSN